MALWRIRATVDDRPGYLSVLTASLALRSVNILAVQVHTTEAGAVDDFLVDAPDSLSEAHLLAAVAKGRGRDAFVTRAEAQGLADQPTRVLALAGRLVHDPDALGDALIDLLDATEVRWRPTPPDRPGFAARRMLLADPAGGSYEVIRRQPTFTPAEYARAQALVEVAGAGSRRDVERVTLLLPDGTEMLIRPATPEDVPVSGWTGLLAGGFGLVAVHGGSVVGMAALVVAESGGPLVSSDLVAAAGPVEVADSSSSVDSDAVGSDAVGSDAVGSSFTGSGDAVGSGIRAEVEVLVADAWRRRGIGTALLRRLLRHAEASGYTAVSARVSPDDVAALHTLRRLGAADGVRDGETLRVALPTGRALPVSGSDQTADLK